jgi:hypothetical protein
MEISASGTGLRKVDLRPNADVAIGEDAHTQIQEKNRMQLIILVQALLGVPSP